MFNLEKVREESRKSDRFDLDCVFISKTYELSKVFIEPDAKQEIISNICKRFLSITNDKTMMDYDPMVKVDDKIDSISIVDVEKLKRMMLSLNDITIIDKIEGFNEIEESKAYILILTNLENGEKVYFFKKFTGAFYLKNKFKLFFSEGRFKKIDSEIFSIDDKFDCVLYDGELAIFTQSSFEQIFDYKDEYIRKADENINKIKKLNIIENIENVQNDSEKITIKKKLARIKDEDIQWFKNEVKKNFDSIKDTIQKVGLDMEAENGKIVSNDTSELIHLIQDDYLKSNVADENQYVAVKKTKIENR